MSPRLGSSSLQTAVPASLREASAAARFRDPYFASFLRHNNRYRTRLSWRDLRSASLWKNRRKAAMKVFRIAAAGGSLWTLMESAKGLAVF